MRFEWIRDVTAIEQHREAWQALEQDVQNRTAYCVFTYIMAWYRCYCGTHLVDNGTPLVGLAWDGNQLVGVAPLIEADASMAKVPVRRAICAGNNLSAGELLIADDAEGVVEGFVHSLRDEQGIDVIFINGLPVGGDRFENLRANCVEAGIRHEIIDFDSYAVVDLKDGFDGYNMSFGWKFRSRNKHIAKKIREAGDLSIDRITSTTDGERARVFCERMEGIQNRSRRTRLGGLELENMHHPFYRELFNVYGQRDAIDATILGINGEDVAFIFAFTERNIYYHTRMAYAEEHGALSPGKFLLQEVFRRIPESGLLTVFSHGDYDYKSRWASTIVSQQTVCVYGTGLRARLAHLASTKLRRNQPSQAT